MESINLKKPNKLGLKAINECLFNFDCNPFWFVYTGGNFIETYWERKRTLIEYSKKFDLKYNLISNGQKVPFVYNRLIF